MTPAERTAVVASLPVWVDIEEYGAMEGDEHREVSQIVEGTLKPYFAEANPTMYLTAGMGAYFPAQPKVVPDVMAVPGGGNGRRFTWVVSHEGLKPEWVLEITVRGDRDKDFRDHVVRYAELGIREYFIADIPRRRVLAYRLADPAIRIYTPVVPQGGRYRSEVLGLDVALEDGKVRFYDGDRRLLDPDERAEALHDALNDEQMLRQEAEQARRDAEQRAADEARARRDAEQARRDAEGRAADEARARHDAEKRAADAAAELARMRELLERLQRGG